MRVVDRFLFLLLLWALAPAPLWAECRLTKISGIESVFEPSRIYVSAKINGRPAFFLVDTGADTLLFLEAAEALGVKIAGTAAGESFGLTGQSMLDSRAVLETLEIGHWRSEKVSLRAIGPITEEDVGGVPVIGLLGDDFLSHFDVEISMRDKLFALYQPQDCQNANLAYWSPDHNIADLIRYTEQNPRIIVKAKLDGKSVSAMIDTGSPYSMMSQDLAASLDVTSDTPGTEPAGSVTGIHGQPVPSWVGTFKSFELDQERIAPAKIDFFAFKRRDFDGASRLGTKAFDVDMLLGLDFVRAHRVLISHSQQKFYFSYIGGKPLAAPKPQDALSAPSR